LLRHDSSLSLKKFASVLLSQTLFQTSFLVLQGIERRSNLGFVFGFGQRPEIWTNAEAFKSSVKS
jgi:hypothetical protein